MAPSGRPSELAGLFVHSGSQLIKITRLRRAHHFCHFNRPAETRLCRASFLASARSPPWRSALESPRSGSMDESEC